MRRLLCVISLCLLLVGSVSGKPNTRSTTTPPATKAGMFSIGGIGDAFREAREKVPSYFRLPKAPSLSAPSLSAPSLSALKHASGNVMNAIQTTVVIYTAVDYVWTAIYPQDIDTANADAIQKAEENTARLQASVEALSNATNNEIRELRNLLTAQQAAQQEVFRNVTLVLGLFISGLVILRMSNVQRDTPATITDNLLVIDKSQVINQVTQLSSAVNQFQLNRETPEVPTAIAEQIGILEEYERCSGEQMGAYIEVFEKDMTDAERLASLPFYIKKLEDIQETALALEHPEEAEALEHPEEAEALEPPLGAKAIELD